MNGRTFGVVKYKFEENIYRKLTTAADLIDFENLAVAKKFLSSIAR